MPFGAQMLDDGTTRFRLWAPGAMEIALETAAGPLRSVAPMKALDDGWFEAILREAPAGTRYSYRCGDTRFPDPASRFNPDDVHGASMVVDPLAFDWSDGNWSGRPWEEAVIYELHIGTFTPEGTFATAVERLDYLVQLGVTALEIMPVADFPGRRNWGYDGVLPFAPDGSYGTPDELKRLVEQAHLRGLMVFLDVVYNHFGPEGNYLHAYAPQFFNPEHHTPWGAAINFDAADSRTVRDFFVQNALYWIEEYRFDGLRLDAVHAIADDSDPDIVTEIALALRAGPGRERKVHLILENDRNQARYLRRDAACRAVQASAQWNDDIHHAFHILITGERDGYYEDYAARPLWYLGRSLAQGFGYQGEISHHRDGAVRGEPSAHLPPAAFVSFLQTHDQVGNRALGERLCAIARPPALRAAVACVLLAPSPPMLFMGEEFAASTPFQFFCDFGSELAAAVTQGRRREFARFERFSNPEAQAEIPDPNAAETFTASKLRWDEIVRPPHSDWLAFHRELLALRHRVIVPRLPAMQTGGAFQVGDNGVLRVQWTLGDGSRLHLIANLSAAAIPSVTMPPGELIYASTRQTGKRARTRKLPGWFVAFSLEGESAR
ncbi:MAG: malto-oligosyltrehalose trehalohydrolase [Betaproteobacteria bacterium RIFCSPLOWO2_12_FULL_63_13]|nr:MAG: malto-oligosyltrehalose trehalohydrolase [Betaproteobacteria bacterium RIFCSPLOWO2_12_FULL_63_13]